ncbi:MAG: RNA ligase family protein [Gammaproteobacteria bacterium]
MGGFLSRGDHRDRATRARSPGPVPAAHHKALLDLLLPELLVFGEWCYAVHGVRYTKLPDWFLAFDIYDRRRQAFWSTVRRDELLKRVGLELVPRLAMGRFDLASIADLLGPSRLGEGPAEGLYVRRDEGDWLVARAKLVRPEFTQSIDEHWTKRSLETNALARGRTEARHRTAES